MNGDARDWACLAASEVGAAITEIVESLRRDSDFMLHQHLKQALSKLRRAEEHLVRATVATEDARPESAPLTEPPSETLCNLSTLETDK